MFTKSFVSLGALALAAVASAKPIPAFKDLLAKRGSYSFNNYGGYNTMSNFDNFYGSSDYSGVSQTLVKNKDVVCHSEQVEIVQQRLAVIREWYKKIITEQICEVEVQTIVHEQFVSGCEGYSSDLRRKSSRDVSYDHDVASQIVDIHDSDNNCVTNDLGWQGYQVGSNAISYSGDNWNSQYSPSSVDTVYGYCQQSYGYSSPSYSSSWSSSYSPPSYGSSGYGSSGYGSSGYSGSYGSSGYSDSYGSYEAPSYSYSAPSYEYDTYSAPSYEYNTYSAPSYDYTYEAPPTYTYDSSYGSGYSYAAPPTYTSASYGYGYSDPSSYGYGSSGYAPPSSGSVSPDVSSNLTDCASCDASAALPSDTASAALPTETSDATGTDVASSAAAAASAPAATGSAADSSAPAAATSAAASSAPAAAASASASA
ncbi:hypothetical protein JB92DRAFT_3147679 [Gautieria morchelliformis]|nr:hypothetical protein JB92DRAFT_3147679 [Gautieria morchelliformis]